MAKTAFPITVFYDPFGAPLAGGSVLIYLTSDVLSPSGQICGSMRITAKLDNTGTMISVPSVYACSLLNPSSVQYVVTAYNATGERVSGPDFVTV